MPKPRMKRPGPAASCTTRASIATCTGWRVEAAMIPQPIVSRSVSRAISAETTGRGARLHPVLAPPRVGLGEPDRVHARLVHRTRRREHLVERLHGELHHADAERHRHGGAQPLSSVEVVGPSGSGSYASGDSGLTPSSAPLEPAGASGLGVRVSRRAVVLRAFRGGGAVRDRLLHLLVERGQHVRDLLVDDRLQHPLPHRADRAGELDVGGPVHRGAAGGVAAARTTSPCSASRRRPGP